MGQPKYQNEFEYTEHTNDITLPLTWKKPRKVFVNSMSDMFHPNATLVFTAKCFDVMIKANWHTYQILTKRPDKMIEFSELFVKYFGYEIPSHIWMGVSVENADYNWRIDELRKVKCHTRFISFEPLIGPIGKVNLERIDWAIIGGESGANFRPVKQEWIVETLNECKAQKVPVFFKQWGGIRPKSGGHELAGKTYREYPIITK